jgi:phenylacetate-coenzyme A ligase PaaK-like adenylate-forming protein
VTALSDHDVYGLDRETKRALLTAELVALSRHHRTRCQPYDRMLAARGINLDGIRDLEDLPFFPVRMFKTHHLSSIDESDQVKVLTSSGTTGQQVSRIVLDKATASEQTRALVRIMQGFIGKGRLPMLIIDHPGVIQNRDAFSARGAGIRGMSTFGRDHTYALRDADMSLDTAVVDAFLERHAGQPVLVFGFTFMLWQYLVEPLRTAGRKLPLDKAVVVHSGGWKKLIDRRVDNETFKAGLGDALGVARVHDFYGMVEQVGSVFVECEAGHLHAPAHSDVIIREPGTWKALPAGRDGIIQVLSCLPRSYPGHSLLTEDVGVLTGEDDCLCGRKGRTFRVLGRIAEAEARGCSDTHAATG